MKVKYFQDTDTLYIEFCAGGIADTRDLDENTLLELVDEGRVCAMTMEHASVRTDIPGSRTSRSRLDLQDTARGRKTCSKP